MPVGAQVLTPKVGTAGRMKIHTTNTAVAGITEWRRSSPANAVPLPHFESPADSTTGLIQPNKLLGMGDNKVNISGLYNLNATNPTENFLANGAYVQVDLLHDKASSMGYANVVGYVTNFETGAKMGNEIETFSCVLEVDGLFPTWGSVP